MIAPAAAWDAAFAGRWATGFEAHGRVWGNPDFAPRGEMERALFARWPGVETVLELGCLEGGRTAHLARQARRVVAVDGRLENLGRARTALRLLGVENVDLRLADLERGVPAAGDAVYAVGVLYHQPRPWELLAACARAAPRLWLWTHVAEEDQAAEPHGPWRLGRHAEAGLGDPLSGLSPHSLWFTRAGLLDCLARLGYRAEVLGEDAAHPNGRALAVAAELGGAPCA